MATAIFLLALALLSAYSLSSLSLSQPVPAQPRHRPARQPLPGLRDFPVMHL